MKALFLSRYDSDGASSRYRLLQYLPALRELGIECDHQPFFPAGYVARKFAGKRSVLPLLPAAYWNRLRMLGRAKGYDCVVLEKEAFPFLPAGLEFSGGLGGLHYAVDYDDAVFHRYDRNPHKAVRALLGAKIPAVMARASTVIVGSDYLYQYASRFNPDVRLIPTVIDLRLYPSAPPRKSSGSPFIIGWIGSQATTRYLGEVEKVLDAFCSRHDAQVWIIGGSRIPLSIRNIHWVPWSGETEVQNLSQIDVGIMPLPSGRWEQGKCAFKLIQYMACWKPVIASAVGENRRVIENGQEGYLVSGDGEWLEALEKLIASRRLCAGMGERGRARVETAYCLDVAVPRMVEVLRSIAQ